MKAVETVVDGIGNGGDGGRACIARFSSDGTVADRCSADMDGDCGEVGDSSVCVGGESECVPMSSGYSVAIDLQSAVRGVKSVPTSNGQSMRKLVYCYF